MLLAFSVVAVCASHSTYLEIRIIPMLASA